MDMYDRINQLLKQKNMTRVDLSNKSKISYNTLTSMFARRSNSADIEAIKKIATALNTTLEYLVSGIESYANFMPISVKTLPLMESPVRCGEKNYISTDEVKYYMAVDSSIKADYCLIAKGDSMINARINDGDIIFVKKQDIVENGEIAVVLIGDEATLYNYILHYVTM